ncbi:unnamed protein product [Pleuronectes platessa]|uniref:Uncharacterized protein n=1 Tax=Pleuronectes platessa TaxID=8262 RepID=A0A9N7VH13_PLEPL|nr:unnamed protein product [Pleuronectes platessa]
MQALINTGMAILSVTERERGETGSRFGEGLEVGAVAKGDEEEGRGETECGEDGAEVLGPPSPFVIINNFYNIIDLSAT